MKICHFIQILSISMNIELIPVIVFLTHRSAAAHTRQQFRHHAHHQSCISQVVFLCIHRLLLRSGRVVVRIMGTLSLRTRRVLCQPSVNPTRTCYHKLEHLCRGYVRMDVLAECQGRIGLCLREVEHACLRDRL